MSNRVLTAEQPKAPLNDDFMASSIDIDDLDIVEATDRDFESVQIVEVHNSPEKVSADKRVPTTAVKASGKKLFAQSDLKSEKSNLKFNVDVQQKEFDVDDTGVDLIVIKEVIPLKTANTAEFSQA